MRNAKRRIERRLAGERQDRGKPMFGAEWASVDAEFWIHYVCNGSQMFNCSNMNEIYSFHPNGANFLMGDGSVRFLAESIDAETFVSLFTRAAGDVVK